MVNVKPEQMDMMRKQTAMCFTSRASSCCGLVRFDLCLFVVIVNVGVFLFLVDFVCRNTLFHLDEGTQGGFEGSNGVGLFVFVCFA